MSDVLASDLASVLEGRGLSIAVAESLTGGMLANALARAPGASGWFRGGVVAYAAEVKFSVLDVTPGPVVCEGAAVQMACGVRDLLGADLGIAVTGVGGPGPEEGQRAGTVWVGVTAPAGTTARLHRFGGDPSDVCDATVTVALAHALDALRQG